MNNFKKLLIFASGAAVGSLVTWKFLKDKYEQLAQEEIDSVKEVFSRRNNKYSEETEDTEVEQPTVKPETTEYSAKLEECGYKNYSEISKKEKPNNDMSNKPYVISPEEFGEHEDYSLVSLTYYSDGVLADDLNDPVDDIEDVVGFDALNHFGDYEDDSVFVRNERLKIDYEILQVESEYSGISHKHPHNTEV